ncbi:MAG: hypothetical protein AAFV29_13495, partial [Myxococcota bacterium]
GSLWPGPFAEVNGVKPCLFGIVLAVSIVLSSNGATARPIAPAIFCQTYSDAPTCSGGMADCSTCHTVPPARHAYGAAIEAALLERSPRPWSDETFISLLPESLRAIEAEDSDNDGYANIDELEAGTFPHDADSFPVIRRCPESSAANGGYDVCRYDERYAFRKVLIDFCGRLASYSELRRFAQEPDRRAAIHRALDRCLDSNYWQGRDGVLYQIAHRKIRPVQSIKAGRNQGGVPLGDYDDDYYLFVFTQLDNRDARALLTADYFVEASSDTPPQYTTFNRDPIADIIARGGLQAQLVVEDRRAGMLTTRWNLVLNTMFTLIPRTTAAQAYRAYLGLDIAKMEGLLQVNGEPVDYDQKGVAEAACADCHTTLDPLSYPFTTYAGFNGGIPFTYSPGRIELLAQGSDDPLRNTPEAGVIFGRPVANLLEWAQVAANSEAFARALTLDYWRHLMGEAPRPSERSEFESLWRDLMTTHNYGVERMLHDLVDTEAYGVP